MIRRWRRAGSQQRASARRRMHRTRSAWASTWSRHAGTRATRLEGGLARSWGSLIKRLSWSRRSWPHRYARSWTRSTRHCGARRRPGLLPQTRRKIRPRWNHGPLRWLSDDRRRRTNWLAGNRALRRRRWPRLSRRCRGTRRRRNWHSRPYSRRGCMWRTRRRHRRRHCRTRRRGHRRSGRQRLARSRKDLAGPWSRRRNRSRCGRRRTQRRAWHSNRHARRSGGRCCRARPDRRMNRCTASQHRRAQRERAWPIVNMRFFLRCRWLWFASHRRRNRFGRGGTRSRGARPGSGGRRRRWCFRFRCRWLRFRGRFAFWLRLNSLRSRWFFLRLRFFRRSQNNRLVAAEIAPQFLGVVVVNRAGMGQRLGNPELMQFIDDLTRLHFELPRQLIDSDLTHAYSVLAFSYNPPVSGDLRR